jgi:ABC-type uncharacterized transport system substrate-binding protein
MQRKTLQKRLIFFQAPPQAQIVSSSFGTIPIIFCNGAMMMHNPLQIY